MSTLYGVVMACITVITLSPQIVDSQIPTACTDAESLENMVCCPDNCGAATGRGRCDDIDLPQDFNMSSTDVRSNWPHYFTRACSCNGNYGGFDCSRCTYGYYGDNCENSATLPRTSIQSLTPEEWRVYIETLKMARDNDSRYSVILEEARPGTPNLSKREVTIYQLFVWLHHYTAKDSECKDECMQVDYAHEATGFPTWHRHYILWLEWEIQYMLKINGRTDYHMFRTHFWDWRSEKNMATENIIIFHADRLGGFGSMSQVTGNSFADWNTICWFKGNLSDNVDTANNRVNICDPTNSTGILLRCPSHTDPEVTPSNPCDSSNKNWPNSAAVEKAINKPFYDTLNYTKYTDNQSFRNFMEGFEGPEQCQKNPLCFSEDMIQRNLHNAVHIIIGLGDFKYNNKDNWDLVGVMADIAASPNDPIFINHHTMIDCILEEWLKRPHTNPVVYPEDMIIKKGHGKNDYIVPFFPLYKHSDRFKTAENFGYSCTLPNSAIVSKPLDWIVLVGAISSLISAMSI